MNSLHAQQNKLSGAHFSFLTFLFGGERKQPSAPFLSELQTERRVSKYGAACMSPAV